MTIGQSVGLEVDIDDIEELMEHHSIELSTDELEHLQDSKKMADEIYENEENKEDVSIALIKEMI